MYKGISKCEGIYEVTPKSWRPWSYIYKDRSKFERSIWRYIKVWGHNHLKALTNFVPGNTTTKFDNNVLWIEPIISLLWERERCRRNTTPFTISIFLVLFKYLKRWIISLLESSGQHNPLSRCLCGKIRNRHLKVKVKLWYCKNHFSYCAQNPPRSKDFFQLFFYCNFSLNI